MGTSSTIDQWGDFNGTLATYYEPSTVSSGSTTLVEQNILPSIDRNFGFGVIAGHREGPWALEVSFWRSDHTASFIFSGPTTFTTPASLQSVDINFKRYFFTQLPTQPYVSLGIAFPWLWVRQGSSLYTSTGGVPVGSAILVNDETFTGIGFDLGAGLEIYLDNGFSIFGGAYQRWTGFNETNGAYKTSEDQLTIGGSMVNGSLEGDGLNLYVGTSVGFQ
jgi:hypothetical protein